jgi:hypothetical protein
MSRVVARTSSILGSGLTEALIVSVRQDVRVISWPVMILDFVGDETE